MHGLWNHFAGGLSLMLGVNATTDSVSRLEKVAWRRTLGWCSADTGAPGKPGFGLMGWLTLVRADRLQKRRDRLWKGTALAVPSRANI